MVDIIRLRRAYNLFHRGQDAGMVCAIPEDCPVPSFIRRPEWTYAGRVHLPDCRVEEPEDSSRGGGNPMAADHDGRRHQA